MSWASDKARGLVDEFLFEPGTERYEGQRLTIERAIRQTIARCVKEVDDAGSADPEVRDIAAAIRKLGEP